MLIRGHQWFECERRAERGSSAVSSAPRTIIVTSRSNSTPSLNHSSPHTGTRKEHVALISSFGVATNAAAAAAAAAAAPPPVVSAGAVTGVVSCSSCSCVPHDNASLAQSMPSAGRQASRGEIGELGELALRVRAGEEAGAVRRWSSSTFGVSRMMKVT